MAILSYPDRTLTALLSGGSWQGTASLTNLQTEILSQVTRSTNALATSSIILADLGSAPPISVIALCAHNISAAGTVRARGFSDAGYTTMVSGADTGTITAWPSGFTAQNVADYPKNWTFCFNTAKIARYWKIEITDTTNAAGYIELGRCWIGEATFAPNIGVSYGMTNGYESRDAIEESVGGLLWGEKRAPRRVLSATFEVLTSAEKRQAMLLQKILTETSEVYWVTHTTAIPEDMLLEAFPCFLTKPSAINYPYFDNNELSILVIERL